MRDVPGVHRCSASDVCCAQQETARSVTERQRPRPRRVRRTTGWEEATLSRHESSTDIATAATREARQELGKNSDFLAGNQVQKRRGCFIVHGVWRLRCISGRLGIECGRYCRYGLVAIRTCLLVCTCG